MGETPVTDVTTGWDQEQPELSAADEQLLRELTERARTGGLRLTGKGRQRWTNRWKAALNAFDITFGTGKERAVLPGQSAGQRIDLQQLGSRLAGYANLNRFGRSLIQAPGSDGLLSDLAGEVRRGLGLSWAWCRWMRRTARCGWSPTARRPARWAGRSR